MCTLYNVKASRAEIAAYFRANDEWRRELDKDYVATGRPGWVIGEAAGQRSLTAMTWGFPPPAGVGAPVVNVRNYASPLWRTALTNPERRCLVAATEFSEWSVKQGDAKQTLHWFSVPSRPIFAMAGVWRPTDKGPVYAFLTCGYDGDASTHLVGAIHPKAIPVILHEEDHDRWLRAPVEEALSLACAFPSQLMTVA